MGWRKFVGAITEHSVLSTIVASASMGLYIAKNFGDKFAERFLERPPNIVDAACILGSAALTVLGAVSLEKILVALHRFSYEKKDLQRVQECITRASYLELGNCNELSDEEKTNLNDLVNFLAAKQSAAKESSDNSEYAFSKCKSLISTPAAAWHLRSNKFDEGLHCLDTVFQLMNGNYELNYRDLGFFSRLKIKFNLLNLAIDRLGFPDSAMNYFCTAAFNVPVDKEIAEYYSRIAWEAAMEFDHKLKKEIYLFHARLDKGLDTWAEAFDFMRENASWKRVGESRMLVKKLQDNEFFEKNFVFKEYTSRTAFENESDSLCVKKKAIPEMIIPANIHSHFVSRGNRYTHIFRHIPGDTLYELLKTKKEAPMEQIIDMLEKFHAKMPCDQVKNLSISWQLRSKLRDKHLGMTREAAKTIIHNYRPVYDGINKNTIRVYSKDANPENWLISDGKIGVIDFEHGYLIPAQFDLVNLLEYGDENGASFTNEQITKHIGRYVGKMRKEGITIDDKLFMRGYYHSIIHRMISFASAWSAPERPHMHGRRKYAMLTAVNAIELLKEKDHEYYASNKEAYDNLSNEFANMAAKL